MEKKKNYELLEENFYKVYDLLMEKVKEYEPKEIEKMLNVSGPYASNIKNGIKPKRTLRSLESVIKLCKAFKV